MAMSKKNVRPQVARDGLATKVVGGDTPDCEDVIESANARAQKSHNMKGKEYADVGVLPSSGGETLDKAGITDSGYLTKKGLEYGVDAFYNTLPPGMDIEDQENADIRTMEFKQVTDLGFPGDGWT
jgi:hypothetical protein